MNTISGNIKEETIINKSRFICFLYKITSIDDVDKYIENVKKEYKGATHYCYAYIFENSKKCSDDREPSGTAGLPILNVLEKNDLMNVLCVVVRYFGGIKLGSGGLVRAYSNSIINALNKAEIKVLKSVKVVNIKFDYTNIKQIDLILKDSTILEKSFNEEISYTIYIDDLDIEILDKLDSLCYKVDILKSIRI